MTLEEQGAYLRLLCYQWLDGPLPKDTRRLAALCGVTESKFQELWPALQECFTETDEGYLNERLYREHRTIERRKKKLSEAGKKGARIREARRGKSKRRVAEGSPKGGQRDPDAITDTESETETEGEGSSLRSSPSRPSGPQKWMHDIWHEELGIEGYSIKLTNKRRKKYRKLYDEHLADAPRPRVAFRAILRRVQQSEHHMSERSYQMPESLFVNEERRDQWVQRTLTWLRQGGKTGKSEAQRRKLADEIEARRSG